MLAKEKKKKNKKNKKNILIDSKLSFTDVMQLHFKCCEEAET